MSTGNTTFEGNHVAGFLGLVVCGGKSSRMGTDKSLLSYHGLPQRYHVFQMLSPFCEKVYLSCNEIQVENIDVRYPFISDLPECKDTGPMGGLLTAFHLFPGKDLLVAGCDYPLLKDRDIADLLSAMANKHTTAFYNKQAEMYEPLVGYYSCRDAALMQQMHSAQQYSLQRFLRSVSAGKFYTDQRSIKSADTKEEYLFFSQLLNNKHKDEPAG